MNRVSLCLRRSAGTGLCGLLVVVVVVVNDKTDGIQTNLALVSPENSNSINKPIFQMEAQENDLLLLIE